MTSSSTWTRRSLLFAGAASLVLTACSDPVLPAEITREQPEPAPAPSSPAPSPPAPELTEIAAYTVLAGEVEPAAKEAAVRFIEASLTRPASPQAASAGPSSSAAPSPAAPAPTLDRYLPASGPAAVRIVYPQYGGLTADRGLASVITLAELVSLDEDNRGSLTRGVTLDVRLASAAGVWTVTEVLPAQPPPAAPSITTAARAVLDNERIILPEMARADLLSGGISDLVCDSLTQLAQQWTLHVAVFTSGHPINVFGTDRMSNHIRGLAVDIWALDGIPVIDHARAPWREALLAADEAGATEVGGPQDLGGRPYFSDHVHQDHLHIGFGSA